MRICIRPLFLLLCTMLGTGWLGAEARRPLRVSHDKETVSVYAGERQVLEYRQVPSPFKPYASKLFSPGGAQVLRDSPSDHKHHHALMFALAAGKVNFWEEVPGAGIERPRSMELTKPVTRDGLERAGLKQMLDWVGGDRELLREERSIEVLAWRDSSATLLNWVSSLTTTEPIALTGSHYFGLGLRFPESMDKEGRFFNSENLEGEVVRGTERLTPVRWCAYTARADSGPVTVAIFDHPANPRHPARMFTMTAPFAYLAATLNLWKEALDLNPGKTLRLVYAVAVWDGAVEPAQIESLYRRWAR